MKFEIYSIKIKNCRTHAWYLRQDNNGSIRDSRYNTKKEAEQAKKEAIALSK